MDRMVNKVKDNRVDARLRKVTNFMGGNSYELNPIDTLRMVTASSIFGEPQYYRDGEFVDATYKADSVFCKWLCFDFPTVKTSTIMEQVIDEALDYNFKETLEWALDLRHEYFMRLNPQVIMVRASVHPKRKEFTEKYPGLFGEINFQVMSRADEPASQLTYWLYKNKTKNNIPSILKRSWADRISNLSRYQIYKYRNQGLGLIDTIRVCHASSPLIDELMQTGTVVIGPEKATWETLRADKKSWEEILQTIDVPHMALLRNLRGIFTEINDLETCKKVCDTLIKGVPSGKQFPFRYWSAYQAIQNSDVNHKGTILDALEECIDVSCDNMPKLSGKTMCLSDNSGSAWGTCNSEYGSVTIAEIDNLSALIAAHNSDEGYVGKFGDKLKVYPVSKRNGILTQLKDINASRGNDVGTGTENGIWLFLKNAIEKKEHWDNLFIFSDMQAGHGGLYGTNPSEYRNFSCRGGHYIDVARLVDEYRRTVNPKVNVFSVQTAGYNNVVIPEYAYRSTMLTGWTGKELLFADAIIKQWNGIEQRNI